MRTFFLTVFPPSFLLLVLFFTSSVWGETEYGDPILESAVEIWEDSREEIDLEGKDVEYSGYNADGDYFSIFSKTVSKKGNQVLLKDVKAKITSTDLGGMSFDGEEGIFYLDERIFYFSKRGTIVTHHGIFMSFNKAKIDLNKREARVVGEVCISTALGRFMVRDVSMKKLGNYISLPGGVKLKGKEGKC